VCVVQYFLHVNCCRLKLYELVEHKVKGDGNCQVSTRYNPQLNTSLTLLK
jgi:hypothetical protein